MQWSSLSWCFITLDETENAGRRIWFLCEVRYCGSVFVLIKDVTLLLQVEIYQTACVVWLFTASDNKCIQVNWIENETIYFACLLINRKIGKL